MSPDWVPPDPPPEDQEAVMDLHCTLTRVQDAFYVNITGAGHAALIALAADDSAAEFVQNLPGVVETMLKDATEAYQATE